MQKLILLFLLCLLNLPAQATSSFPTLSNSEYAQVDPEEPTKHWCKIAVANKIIGEVTWARDYRKDNGASMHSFYIEPAFRNKGYGALLFEYAIETFRQCGLTKVALFPIAYENQNNVYNDKIIMLIDAHKTMAINQETVVAFFERRQKALKERYLNRGLTDDGIFMNMDLSPISPDNPTTILHKQQLLHTVAGELA
jgi:GNAT superfamily N-acetyltransferase